MTLLRAISRNASFQWEAIWGASPFPRFVSLWVPIYSLIRWWGSFHGKLHEGHTVYCPYRLHKPISGACHDPHQNMSRYIGTHKETNRGNGLAWVDTQNCPYWNEALGEMFSQKRHLRDMLFKTVWKKNLKMFWCYKKNKS